MYGMYTSSDQKHVRSLIQFSYGTFTAGWHFVRTIRNEAGVENRNRKGKPEMISLHFVTRTSRRRSRRKFVVVIIKLCFSFRIYFWFL